MITAEQADFQVRDEHPFDWCETNFFSFNIPEEKILGMIYVLTRPKLGVCMSDITIQDRISRSWEDQLYVDYRMHLPCPKTLLEYSLPNGLSVKCVEPLKHYRVDYVGTEDTEIHIDCHGLMPPYDINDPAMDPLAERRKGPHWTFAGHYELTSRVVGHARIRGRDYAIDCVDTLDRSWSVRSEGDHPNAIWLHASFGEDLTIHLLADHRPAETNRLGMLYSGYVLENGEVFGLVEASGESEYSDIFSVSTILDVKDVRGKTFKLTGSVISASRWQPYSSMIYPQSLMRWNLDGRIGYGVQQDSASRAYLCRHRDLLRAG